MVYFGTPPSFSSLTHLVVYRIRGFLLKSKVKLPSLVGVGEVRSTRGTPQAEENCDRQLEGGGGGPNCAPQAEGKMRTIHHVCGRRGFPR